MMAVMTLLLLSERAACQQIDAGVEIYKVEYTYLDTQSDKSIPSTLTQPNVQDMVSFDKSSTYCWEYGSVGNSFRFSNTVCLLKRVPESLDLTLE